MRGRMGGMPRYSIKKLLLTTTLVAVLLFVALWVVDNGQVAFCDGRFPLQVDLRENKQLGITEVAYQVLSRTDYAEYVRTAPSKLELNPEHVDWIAGQPFSVQVPCSVRVSTSGRVLSYSQHRLLVLRITYQNGSVELIPVEIPDGRANRHISVTTAENPPSN